MGPCISTSLLLYVLSYVIYLYIHLFLQYDRFYSKENETIPILHIPSHTQDICEYLEKSLEVEGCIPNMWFWFIEWCQGLCNSHKIQM